MTLEINKQQMKLPNSPLKMNQNQKLEIKIIKKLNLKIKNQTITNQTK